GIDQPDLFFGFVMCLQPVAPLFAVCDIQSLGNVHASPPQFVLVLHKSVLERLGCQQVQLDVLVQRTEERQSFTDEDGNGGDGHFVHQAFAQKALDGHAAVEVDLSASAPLQFVDQLTG